MYNFYKGVIFSLKILYDNVDFCLEIVFLLSKTWLLLSKKPFFILLFVLLTLWRYI